MRDTLIKTYHLESLSEEKQNEMIESIGSLIFQGVLLRVAPQMSEDQQNKLEAMLESQATPDELMGFMSAEIPDFEAIVKEEAEGFKSQSEAIMSQIGN